MHINFSCIYKQCEKIKIMYHYYNRDGALPALPFKGGVVMKVLCCQEPMDPILRTPAMKEQLDEVGFVYYLVLARLHDITPRSARMKEQNGMSQCR